MSEKSMTIIASKGTLDWAYPPFILSSTAAALGYNVNIFFTFYGLQLLKKNLNLSVSPLGNPGMPMPMGMDKWFPVLGTAIPGMQAMMTGMMKNTIKSKGVASVAELRKLCLEADVKMIGELPEFMAEMLELEVMPLALDAPSAMVNRIVVAGRQDIVVIVRG